MQESQSNMSRGSVTVAVLGGANAGKSTMLNFFIGETLLPSNSQIETASVTYVTHDRNIEGYECKDDASETTARFPSVDEANQWIKEKNQEARQNHRESNYDAGIPSLHISTNIQVTGVQDLVPQNIDLQLVDVPGINEANNQASHEKIQGVLRIADMILVVVKHEDVGTDIVQRLGDMVRRHGRTGAPVFLLINKIDSIATQEERNSVQQEAHRLYGDRHGLFGDREIRVLCTQGIHALRTLCKGELCIQTGSCELFSSLSSQVFSMQKAEQQTWLQALLDWNNNTRRLEIHDKMVTRVRKESGVEILRSKLLYLIVRSAVTARLPTIEAPIPEEFKTMLEQDWEPLVSRCESLPDMQHRELLFKLLHINAQYTSVLDFVLPEESNAIRTAKDDALKDWEKKVEAFLEKNKLSSCEQENTSSSSSLKTRIADALTLVLREIMGPKIEAPIPEKFKTKLEQDWEPLVRHCNSCPQKQRQELLFKLLHIEAQYTSVLNFVLPEEFDATAKADALQDWEKKVEAFMEKNKLSSCEPGRTSSPPSLKKRFEDVLTPLLRQIMEPGVMTWSSAYATPKECKASEFVLNAYEEYNKTSHLISELRDQVREWPVDLDLAWLCATDSWKESCKSFLQKENMEYIESSDMVQQFKHAFAQTAVKNLLSKVPWAISEARRADDVVTVARTSSGIKVISLAEFGELPLEAGKTLLGIYSSYAYLVSGEAQVRRFQAERDFEEEAIGEMRRSFVKFVEDAVGKLPSNHHQKHSFEPLVRSLYFENFLHVRSLHFENFLHVRNLYLEKGWKLRDVAKATASVALIGAGLGAFVGAGLVYGTGVLAAGEGAMVAGGTSLGLGSLSGVAEFLGIGNKEAEYKSEALRDWKTVSTAVRLLQQLRTETSPDLIIECVKGIRPFSERFKLIKHEKTKK